MVNLQFDVENKFTTIELAQALYNICKSQENLVFVFIGTDANMGDSLGPLCGVLLKETYPNVFFYGNLSCPITAKDIPFISHYIKYAHPLSYIVVIDAALGNKEDLNTIKISQKSIKPGLGVNKNLPEIGDASIIGVIGEKNSQVINTNGLIRLSSVYKMATIISSAISEFLTLYAQKNKGDFSHLNNIV